MVADYNVNNLSQFTWLQISIAASTDVPSDD